MNLSELLTMVHGQTQTTTGDLPDPTITNFLQQAFERTINGETQWPFYETTWQLSLANGQYQVDLPGDVNQAGIISLYDADRGIRMVMVAEEWAETWFPDRPTWDDDNSVWVSDTTPINLQVWYTVWGGKITFWPQYAVAIDPPTEPRSFMLRGYRQPLSWLTPADEPDCDPRLHVALAHYATALAYAQQEDETLETTYMDRWQRDAEAARRAIMEPRHQRPLAMAGSIDAPVPRVGPGWVLVPPTP